MARPKNNVLDDLYELFVFLPWWVGIPVALVAYGLFTWVIPSFNNGSGILPVGAASRQFAPLASGLVILVWLFALGVKLQRRRLLDSKLEIQSIRDMSWLDFERLVGEVYRRQGYLVSEAGGAQPDGGIDLVLTKGLKRTLVQCKHWKSQKVGIRPVRELYGVMAGTKATAGKFVVTGSFTADAEKFAKGKDLELVNGEALWRLVEDIRGAKAASHTQVTNTISVAADNVSTLDRDLVNPIFQAKFPEPIMCPKCGAEMIEREAKRGANAGSAFWGCSQFPRCRGTRT